MEQYIPKSALVAAIERRIKTNKECMLGLRNLDYYQGKVDALKDTLSSLDSLEMKEVDLEQETQRILDEHFFYPEEDDELKEIPKLARYIAKHFFNLGLKAKIMTSKLQQRISVLKMGFWTGLQTFENSEMTLSDAYNQGVDDILEELGLNAQKGEKV